MSGRVRAVGAGGDVVGLAVSEATGRAAGGGQLERVPGARRQRRRHITPTGERAQGGSIPRVVPSCDRVIFSE